MNKLGKLLAIVTVLASTVAIGWWVILELIVYGNVH